jgi:hypothetical protein
VSEDEPGTSGSSFSPAESNWFLCQELISVAAVQFLVLVGEGGVILELSDKKARDFLVLVVFLR